MPTYRSRATFNTDGFNEGLSALGKAFAPPTAQETLAFQKAASDRESSARLAELYRQAGDANLDTTVFDRRAGIAGAYAPNQSMTAVNANNATTLRTNAADNVTKLQQTRLQGQNSLAEAYAKPVVLGEGQTAFLPDQTQAATGLPRTIAGAFTLNPGQQANVPDGRVLSGAPAPRSMDQVKADEFAGMPPELRQAMTFGNTPTPTVSTADGLRITTAPQSIGQAPAPDAAAKPDLRNYKDGDRTGTAVYRGDGWYDAQDGHKLSSAVQTYSSQLQGNAADTGLGTTAKNGVESQMVDLANLEGVVNQFDDLIKRDPSAIGTTGRVMGFGQDVAATAQEVTGLLNPKLQAMAKDAERGLVDPEVMAKNFNPNIPQAQLLENLLVAQLAKTNDPNGRLSNQAMDQTRAALGGGGWFQNAQKTRASLDGIRQQIASKRAMYSKIAPEAAALGPGAREGAPAPAAPPAPAQQSETWVRGPNGKLQRAQ